MSVFHLGIPDSHGKHDMDTESPILASRVTFTTEAAEYTQSDVFWDSYHTTKSGIYNSNSSSLLNMCDVVQETDCGPQWAMVCFNVIGGLIVVLNIMHVLAISATPQIRKSANAKGLFNLAAADLIYGLTIISTYNCVFTKLIRLRRHLPLCAGIFAAVVGLLGLSGGTLVLMSLERCIIICVPFVNRQKTNRVFKSFQALLWVTDVSCCIAVTWKNILDQNAGKTDLFCHYGIGACGFRWSGAGLPQGIAMYGGVILFIMAMLCANIAIIVRVQKSKRFQTKSSNGRTVSARNIKTAQLVGLMCLCYSFCWCCIFLWLGFRILKPEYVRPWHSHLSLIIVTSNSMMNPLIYGMASPEYRRTLRNMFRKGWRKAMSMALASADLTSQNYNSENEDPDEQPSRQPSCSNATVNAGGMKEKKELSKIEISTIESVRA